MKSFEITNPEKIIDSDSKTTKLDLLNYYDNISSFILPHIKNRPLSVIRCHNGVNNEYFFKKHPTTEKDYVEIFLDDNEEYFYIKNKTQLLYQIQMGTIEFHPWASRVEKVEHPNIMIFDLDPAENVTHSALVQGVFDLKSVLDQLNLTSFIKTSGGKGYHIVLPFSTCKDWKTFNEFASSVALLVESKWPKLYTTNIRKKERKGKIFIDWLRNARAATCAGPYSLRARSNLPISFPISWDKVEKIRPNEITIKNFKKHLKNNPWENFFKTKQGLK